MHKSIKDIPVTEIEDNENQKQFDLTIAKEMLNNLDNKDNYTIDKNNKFANWMFVLKKSPTEFKA